MIYAVRIFTRPIVIGVLLIANISLFSQSNIQQSLSVNSDGSAPNPSAQLDVSATDKGMLVPRMTTVQRSAIVSPATGLLVFDTTTGGFWFYNGTSWATVGSTGIPTIIQDADTDTKIQVEKNPDEDIIRFDLSGTEHLVLRKNAGGTPRLEFLNSLNNIFVGQGAGASNTTGSSNTASGTEALYSNTTGDGNVANGVNALRSNIIGSYNTASGWGALYSNLDGGSNVATGADALRLNTVGHNNTALGTTSLYSNTVGSDNTATGSEALYSNTTGTGNVANGVNALRANTLGNFNIAIGTNALYSNTTGVSNVAMGADALRLSTTGSNNTAIGTTTLYSNAIGFNNSATGNAALKSNITGNSNSAHGMYSLYSNTIGSNNTAIGTTSLYLNTTGNNNTASGQNALRKNTTGLTNTAQGVEALYSNTTGSSNTASGGSALYTNATGSNNTGLGHFADVSVNNLANASVIGNSATVNASDKVRIGNTNVTVIEGQVDWTFPSDARFKFNIHDDKVPGLAFINQLRPVTYQFDTRKFDEHLMQNMPDSIRQSRLLSGLAGQDYSKSSATVQTGFLAQEVEQVCKKLGYQFSGLHVPESEVDNYGLAYGSFVPLLVKGMQEQQTIIEAQKEEIDLLKSKLDKITAALQGAGIAVEK